MVEEAYPPTAVTSTARTRTEHLVGTPSTPTPKSTAATIFRGALIPGIENLSADIKVIVSGHTHEFYNCTIAGHAVTSASSFGRVITRINVTIDSSTDTITSVAATNDTVTRDVSKDPAQK
jgi:2',3'-cyclic-nucleotide 2'-phosphodiesterase (5'-nucleotidase family)